MAPTGRQVLDEEPQNRLIWLFLRNCSGFRHPPAPPASVPSPPLPPRSGCNARGPSRRSYTLPNISILAPIHQNPLKSPRLPPARYLLGSKAKPSRWHHGPTDKVLAAAEAAQQEHAAEWRAQLSALPSYRPASPPLLLLHDQSALPASPPALPAVVAVPITALDIPLPVVSELIPIAATPSAPPTPSAVPPASPSRLSQADTPPPGTTPLSPTVSASPPIIFTGGKRRRFGDTLHLSELPEIAAAYSPLRVKAARKAARHHGLPASAPGSSTQLTRSALEARAARLERLGCTGPARAIRVQLDALPPPKQDFTPLLAPRAT